MDTSYLPKALWRVPILLQIKPIPTSSIRPYTVGPSLLLWSPFLLSLPLATLVPLLPLKQAGQNLNSWPWHLLFCLEYSPTPFVLVKNDFKSLCRERLPSLILFPLSASTPMKKPGWKAEPGHWEFSFPEQPCLESSPQQPHHPVKITCLFLWGWGLDSAKALSPGEAQPLADCGYFFSECKILI